MNTPQMNRTLLACARTYLIQEILFNNKDTSGFRGFLEENYPNYISIVTNIVKTFNENGYDTPSKQNAIIKQLSKQYPVERFIRAITL